jgi:hypothetical protein
MRSPRTLAALLCPVVFASLTAHAATKPKVVTFGRWMTVKYYAGPDETTALDLKVRPMLLNGESALRTHRGGNRNCCILHAY